MGGVSPFVGYSKDITSVVLSGISIELRVKEIPPALAVWSVNFTLLKPVVSIEVIPWLIG
jgi:hypothetical protein